MKRLLAIFLIAALISNSLKAQPYPTRFSWLYNPIIKEDQIQQGPCNTFSALANAEAWFEILYGHGSTDSLSKQFSYSLCHMPGPQTIITQALEAMRVYGVVGATNVHWGDHNLVQCFFQNCGDPYFATLINAPNFSCSNGYTAPELFYVTAWQVLPLTTIYHSLSNYDKLKRALLNYGPISLNLTTTASSGTQLHGNATHAYLLYGWDASNNWLLKDSWPGTPDSIKYTGDLIGDISSRKTLCDTTQIAVLTNSPTANAVYGIEANGQHDPGESTIKGIPVTVTGDYIPVITLSGMNSTYITSDAPATVSLNSLAMLDSYTVQWFSTPATGYPNSSANFGSPNNYSSTIFCGVEGYVYINAKIIRPNGLTEVVTYPNAVYVSPGIPVHVRQNYDFCSGTNRNVDWEIVGNNTFTAPSSLRVTWNPQIPGNISYGITYNTDYFLNNVIIFTFYNVTSGFSYVLRPLVTDNNYPGINESLTQPGNEQSCGSGHSLITVDKTSEVRTAEDGETVISIFPNPASSSIIINLPTGGTYTVSLRNVLGTRLQTLRRSGGFMIDVSRYARGIYIIEVLDKSGNKKPYVQKLLLQ